MRGACRDTRPVLISVGERHPRSAHFDLEVHGDSLVVVLSLPRMPGELDCGREVPRPLQFPIMLFAGSGRWCLVFGVGPFVGWSLHGTQSLVTDPVDLVAGKFQTTRRSCLIR